MYFDIRRQEVCMVRVNNHLETEVRFGVGSISPTFALGKFPSESIRQHYVPLTTGEYVRVREGRTHHTWTIKRGYGVSREESSVDVCHHYRTASDMVKDHVGPNTEFGMDANRRALESQMSLNHWLLGELSPITLNKTRYHLGNGWTLDVLTDPEAEGISLLEYEGDDIDTARESIPSWAIDVREVTTEIDNATLARWIWEKRHGLCDLSPLQRMTPVKRISLDGGPGCGKTTLINRIRTNPKYRDDIVIVPEAARILNEAALIDIGELAQSPSALAGFEGMLYRFHEAVFDQAKLLAQRNQLKAVIEDRHAIHPLIFMDGNRDLFERSARTTVERELTKGDLIIYLELPTREIYEEAAANDKVRYEDWDRAVERDRLFREIYQGFGSRLVTVPFEADFSRKEAHVLELIDAALAG